MRVIVQDKKIEEGGFGSSIGFIQDTVKALSDQLDQLEKVGTDISESLSTEIKKNVERAMAAVNIAISSISGDSAASYLNVTQISSEANSPIDPWVYDSKRGNLEEISISSKSSLCNQQHSHKDLKQDGSCRKGHHSRHSHRCSKRHHRHDKNKNEPGHASIVVCDSCDSEISGVRWKCIKCQDYDLCHNCNFSESIEKHEHPVYAIPLFEDRKYIVASKESDSIQKILCDNCSSTINGIVWSCNLCEGIDFCSKCKFLSEPFHTNYNEGNHALFPSYHVDEIIPGGSGSSQDIEVYVGCDNCGSRIGGEIFRCDICDDFDLCVDCFPKLDTLNHEHRDFIVIRPSHERFNSHPLHKSKSRRGREKSKSRRGHKVEDKKCSLRIDEIENEINLTAHRKKKSEEKISKKSDDGIKNRDRKASRKSFTHNRNSEGGSVPDVRDNSGAPLTNCSPEYHRINNSGVDSSHSVDEDLRSHKKDYRRSLFDIQKKVIKESERTLRGIGNTVMNSAEIKSALNWGYNLVNRNNQTSSSSYPQQENSLVQNNSRFYHESLSGLNAFFVEDLTIPDSTFVAPGEKFVKIWSVANVGEIKWPECTKLVFLEGTAMGDIGQCEFPVFVGNIYEKTSIVADMVAPMTPGHYRSKWRLSTGDGGLFGDQLWCDIFVEASGEEDVSKTSVDHAANLSEDVSCTDQVENVTSQIDSLHMNEYGDSVSPKIKRSKSSRSQHRSRSKRETRRETLAEYTNALTETLTPVFETFAKASAGLIQDIIRKGTAAQNSYKESKSENAAINPESSKDAFVDDRTDPKHSESGNSIDDSAKSDKIGIQNLDDGKKNISPTEGQSSNDTNPENVTEPPKSEKVDTLLEIQNNEGFDLTVLPTEPKSSNSPQYTDILVSAKSDMVKENLDLIGKRLSSAFFDSITPNASSTESYRSTLDSGFPLSSTSLPSFLESEKEVHSSSPAIVHIEPIEQNVFESTIGDISQPPVSGDTSSFQNVEIDTESNNGNLDIKTDKKETSVEAEPESEDFEMVYSIHEAKD
ncbi:Next to BRCA1 gene 1 protein [Smittium mucronatum]|uniref:Next to BRCA1 gene 1 protein n=1 Tax=Smittium mucronatum TaxID=133383 RepID=A0A1R0H7Z9_9FUNG|nr:Next to BRCA1 gene 1 protein [Smittium mucronatum]